MESEGDVGRAPTARLAGGGFAVCSLDGAAGNVDKKCGLLSDGRTDSVQSERETNGARIDLARTTVDQEELSPEFGSSDAKK